MVFGADVRSREDFGCEDVFGFDLSMARLGVVRVFCLYSFLCFLSLLVTLVL